MFHALLKSSGWTGEEEEARRLFGLKETIRAAGPPWSLEAAAENRGGVGAAFFLCATNFSVGRKKLSYTFSSVNKWHLPWCCGYQCLLDGSQECLLPPAEIVKE